MNTNTFGHATGFVYATEMDLRQVAGGMQSLQRQLQGFFAQNGQLIATASPRLSITALANAPRTAAFGKITPPVTDPPDLNPARAQQPAALALIDDIQQRSNLTLEEIATLTGTSRRTIQNWRAGERINSRNDQRLRKLAHAIRAIDAGDAGVTRDRLFRHEDGQISPYSLLAEERYDTAIAIAAGNQPARAEPIMGNGLRPEVAARLSIMPDREPLSAGTRSRRRLRTKTS